MVSSRVSCGEIIVDLGATKEEVLIPDDTGLGARGQGRSMVKKKRGVEIKS
jgi:hypothetical protein